MPKPLLLWDFDGVMADSTQFVFSYWQQAMKTAGIDFTLQDYQATFTHKFPFEYLAENFPSVAPTIKKDYTAYEAAHYPNNVLPYDGFLKNFNTIADQYEHHVISSNLKTVIQDWLQIHKLSPHFKTIVGRETVGYKDQKIKDLLKRLGRTKNEALFIGDTISDMEHAQAAGVAHIAVSWGVHSHDQLKTVSPNLICDTIEALFNRLKHAR